MTIKTRIGSKDSSSVHGSNGLSSCECGAQCKGEKSIRFTTTLAEGLNKAAIFLSFVFVGEVELEVICEAPNASWTDSLLILYD